MASTSVKTLMTGAAKTKAVRETETAVFKLFHKGFITQDDLNDMCSILSKVDLSTSDKDKDSSVNTSKTDRNDAYEASIDDTDGAATEIMMTPSSTHSVIETVHTHPLDLDTASDTHSVVETVHTHPFDSDLDTMAAGPMIEDAIDDVRSALDQVHTGLDILRNKLHMDMRDRETDSSRLRSPSYRRRPSLSASTASYYRRPSLSASTYGPLYYASYRSISPELIYRSPHVEDFAQALRDASDGRSRSSSATSSRRSGRSSRRDQHGAYSSRSISSWLERARTAPSGQLPSLPTRGSTGQSQDGQGRVRGSGMMEYEHDDTLDNLGNLDYYVNSYGMKVFHDDIGDPYNSHLPDGGL